MLAAEVLLAVTGVFPPRPLRVGDGRAAEKLPREWERRIRAWFDSEKNTKFKLQEAPDFRKLWEKLSEGISIDETAKLVSGLANEDLSQAYQVQLSNAREYLRSVWPVTILDSATGPVVVEPHSVSRGRASALYAVVNDPTRILAEFEMGTLASEQVDAFKEVYPDTAKMLDSFIEAEIIRRRAAKQSYTLPWRIERTIRLFRGKPLVTSIEQIEQAPPKTGAPAVKVDFSADQTKAQKVDAA